MERQIKKLDFSKVTRDSKFCGTHIRIRSGHHGEIEITCGRSSLDFGGSSSGPKFGRLTARAAYGVTDFEHDSAYIFQIVGVELGFIDNHSMHYSGILLARRAEDLHLSLDTNYDPTKIDGATMCEGKKDHCSHGSKHPIVPEGYWAGPKMKSEALYTQLMGSAIEVIVYTTATTFKE